MKTFLAIIGFMVLFIVSPIWYGYVLSILWGWFILPAFHTPQISIPLAIGISIVVRMFTYTNSSDQSDKSSKFSEKFALAIAISFFLPLYALVFGAIVHSFMG
jgi:hypothetical protein